MKRLTGKVALLTGGNVGIGKAIAARLQQESLEVFKSERGPDNNFTGLIADLTDPNSPELIIHQIINETVRLDILVNNACMMQESKVEETDLQT